VPTTFDGLLAKVIAHGADRAEAFDRLAAALDQTVVLGLQTNLPLLRALVADPEVRAGRLDTTLLERTHAPVVTTASPAAVRAARALQARAGRFRVGLVTAPDLPTAVAADGTVHVLDDGRDRRFAPDLAPDVAETAARPTSAGGGGVSSPMPGRVLAVACAEGDHVAVGTVLAVLEAMKMEHPVTAPFDATVVAVRCAAGDQITAGAELFFLEARPT
jgi:acetyl/propionyl-CoA carboxylase alpha subunit